MASGKTAIVVVGIAIAVVLGAVLVFYPNIVTGPVAIANSNELSTEQPTAPSGKISPVMVLTILKDNQDNSIAVNQFAANNTEPITLAEGQHIRFESPDYRTPDSMKVVALSQAGTVYILLKSYDVNNEFFAKLEDGSYTLRVQATWSDLGTHFYLFNVNVT